MQLGGREECEPLIWAGLCRAEISCNFFESTLCDQTFIFKPQKENHLHKSKQVSCKIQPAPQPPANSPTGHQMSQQWTKMTKNAYFGPILAVFGPKILIFMGVSKSFGTNITENHLNNLSPLFFGQALDQMSQQWTEMPILG